MSTGADKSGFTGSRRILVVDDEEAIAMLIQEILNEYEVDVCLNGRDALAMIEAKQYDLVLCDLMMPRMSGMQLYEACVGSNPLIARRFFFLTGGACTPLARDFLESVECPKIMKPFRPSELRDQVCSAFEA